MRIGIDISPLMVRPWTGVQRLIYNLVTNLVSDYPDIQWVFLLVVARKDEALCWWKELLNNSNVEGKKILFPARFLRGGMNLWQKGGLPPVEWWLGRVDIWHSFDSWVIPSLATSTGFVCDLTVFRMPEFHRKEQVRLSTNRIGAMLARNNKIFCLSMATLNDMKSIFKVSDDRLSVVYPGLEIERWSNRGDGEVEMVLKKFDLKRGFFLSVGTVEPRKNMGRLMEAYSLLRKRVFECPDLVVAGGEGWGGLLSDYGERKKQGVRFLGYVDEDVLGCLYQSAGGFVYPSLYEGFGLPVLEALANGLVVVTSASSSLPEAGGEGAIYVNPYSVESIALGLESLIRLDSDEKNELVQIGFDHAHGFDYRRSAKQMMRVWREVIS